ncbi:hypothetical protein HKD37_10G028427 [Glycine soja]
MTGPLDVSISCFLIKVDPWVLVPITFRGLYVLAIRGLHILACRGLHALTFRGLRVLIFIPGPPPDIGGRPTVRAHPEREAIMHLVCIPGDRAHKTPSGPEEVQQGPEVSSSSYGPLSVLQGARSPSKESHPQGHPVDLKKSNRALGFPALGLRPQGTQWTRRSPTGSWSFQALITGLCQFYGVPITPSKVIRPPTNRAFIKKYCVPRQAQGETPQQHGDGRQRATDALPSPLEFTSAHPQKGNRVPNKVMVQLWFGIRVKHLPVWKKSGGPFGPANKSCLEPHELIVVHASSTNESGAPRIDCLALFANSPFSNFIRSLMN